ncbi:MAG TPA: hypothetical protein PK198_02395, partial [Saprospiraceae bacterium]|nr:hypothetical protein [Saprospiraceae bacterium]
MSQSFSISRLPAQAVSVLFHPLLMPTYMLAVLLLVNPYLFGVNSWADPISKLLLLRVFISTFLLPAVGVGMLRGVGFISSLEMPDKSER